MIPLKDDIPSSRFPLVNISLIIVNLVIFVYLVLNNNLDVYIMTHGVVPKDFFSDFSPFTQFYLFTIAIFLHGGWLHVLGNMLYLWIFGDNVEDRMGHFRYLIFYMICGYTATLAHVLADPLSTMPMVGASGAIAGVLGAYLVLFPRARVLTLLPIFFFITFIRIPAVLFLAFWFILQIFNGMVSGSAGVAWWAHIGGFIVGMLLVKFMEKKKNKYFFS
ncbi:Rhomboid family protein [Desulfofarcimen acetoxidans DSM 771]|jgi:membrane associated rhomboid family serine protease|uniref:Rhomboid family protein n=1 Tax=Desulfofarcimen acetoxidans (strain ATCC 49208 / DSM 771 / KCTC 5769 / VKM B-1644 / 5575) TaxID=485916 RepID=C8W425_DESAS|nr:rhomboid family intramembrane serine protease [Desulfofarcimen acetoxidans]ACV61279.1 Rhomboid family protein [Desulfofarcimen acetoxidans DSM 771]